MSARKAIGYGLGASVAVSLALLLVGAYIFGFQLAHWAEWQGQWIGAVGTIAGVAAAAVGAWFASRTGDGHPVKGRKSPPVDTPRAER